MTTSTAEKAASAVKKTTTRTATKRVTKPAAEQVAAKPVPPTAKPAKSAKPATKAAAPKAEKAEKPKKPKLVRDSFTMPEDEYALLSKVKKACVGAGVEIKKSELLRIGVALLATMDAKAIKAAQLRLTPLKAGRPKKK